MRVPFRTKPACLAALALVALAGGLFAKPPNLVLFLSDDHGAIDSAPYGARDMRTPNMTRLAEAGLLFTRAFVTSPACAPSRASLLTGLYPARNGAEANHAKPAADLRKFPSYLQELGYEVVAFGKVSHYRHTADYGFDHFAHDTFHDHEAIPAALEYLARRESERPLCLLVGSNWPHVPWPDDPAPYRPGSVTLPPTFIDTPETRLARAQYYAAVEKMDAELGSVYDAAREMLGDTFFLHTSDHGLQMPFGKWNLYDAGIQVPMIAVWPGRVAAGSRTEAMVQWIDILPTLIELAGGDPPTAIDGRSFASVLLGEADRHRAAIYATHSGDRDFNVYPMRSVRTQTWKYIRNLHPEFQYATHINRGAPRSGSVYWRSWERAARDDDGAMAIVDRYRRRPPEELYDIRNDRHEQHNMAADPRYADALRAMRGLLDGWLRETGDPQTVFGNPLMLGEEATTIR